MDSVAATASSEKCCNTAVCFCAHVCKCLSCFVLYMPLDAHEDGFSGFLWVLKLGN